MENDSLNPMNVDDVPMKYDLIMFHGYYHRIHNCFFCLGAGGVSCLVFGDE